MSFNSCSSFWFYCDLASSLNNLKRGRNYCVYCCVATRHIPFSQCFAPLGRAYRYSQIFRAASQSTRGWGGGDSDGLVFHPREVAKFLVTAHFQNNFLSAKNLSFLESLNCFIFFQVYCEYRALLAEDATSSRQKNVRHFALYELCCS